MNPYPSACLAAGPLPMLDVIADPPAPRCYPAVPVAVIPLFRSLLSRCSWTQKPKNLNRLSLIIFSLRARDAARKSIGNLCFSEFPAISLRMKTNSLLMSRKIPCSSPRFGGESGGFRGFPLVEAAQSAKNSLPSGKFTAAPPRIGRAARDTLAAIPDTPAVLKADRAFIAAHPLPLDRAPHPLGAQMGEVWHRLSAYLDRAAELNQREQST